MVREHAINGKGTGDGERIADVKIQVTVREQVMVWEQVMER